MNNNLDRTLDRKESKSALVQLCIYTLFFCVIALGIYYLFITNSKVFLRYGFVNNDSFTQRYMFAFEFKRFISNLFSGGQINTWDWSIGLGADGLAFNMASIFNPFSWILYFTPDKYVDIAFSISSVVKVYLAGAALIPFARKIGFGNVQVVSAGLLYAFCPWILEASLVQPTFLVAPIMLPLILLGIEKILREESPLLFIVSVAYTVAVTFYFAYILGIITLLYYVIRRLTEYRSGSIKEAFTRFMKFVLYGATGLLISSVTLLITMMKYSASTSSSSTEITKILSMQSILRLPVKLVDWISIFGSNSYIGVSAVCLVVLPLILYGVFRKKTNSVMAIILFIFVIFPPINSLFNFFSYPSGRWMFVLAFFIVIAAVECIGEEWSRTKWAKAAMVSFLGLYAIYILWIKKILLPDEKKMVFINCLAAAIILLLLLVKKKESSGAFINVAVFAVALASTVAVYNVSGEAIYEGYEGYLDAGQAQELMRETPQRAGAAIEDKSFYRVDQVDEVTGDRSPHSKINEAMYFGNRTNYVFNSSIDVKWLEFNKLTGNSQGYYTRVSPNSNDQRFGLDLLQGTKYFLGDELVPYGFDYYKTLDGVAVQKSKYNIGIGGTYDKYIYRSQWEKLSYANRELAMLRAVVLPDGKKVPKTMTETKAENYEDLSTEIKYKKEQKEGKTIISANCPPDREVLLTVKNVSSDKEGLIRVRAEYGDIMKIAKNTRGSARGFNDSDDLTFRLGEGRGNSQIKLEFSVGDEEDPYACEYENIELSSVPHKVYDTLGSDLVKRGFANASFNNDVIKGKVHADKAGLLYLSILEDGGWDILIDGKKVEKIRDVQIAFVGTRIPEGTHEVELKYHTRGFWPGVALSFLGVVVLVVILKKRRNLTQ